MGGEFSPFAVIRRKKMEYLEMKCFEIISNVGSAKSFYLEAIAQAKTGAFEEAKASIVQGTEFFQLGHHAHMELVQKEAMGEGETLTLLLAHAEDQLMAADSFKIIAQEFIDLYTIVFSK